MVSLDSTVKASTDLVYSDLAGEAIILSLKSGEYFGLDEIGAGIWKLIQKPTKIWEIRDAILRDNQVEQGRCEKDIIDLIQDMEKEGLVEVND